VEDIMLENLNASDCFHHSCTPPGCGFRQLASFQTFVSEPSCSAPGVAGEDDFGAELGDDDIGDIDDDWGLDGGEEAGDELA